MARNKRKFGSNKVANFGEVKAMREEMNKLVGEVDELKTKLAAAVTLLLEVKTKQGTHTHTGVTVGAGVSGAASTLTYTATDPSATFASAEAAEVQ
jgi:hypothetical protein